MLLAPKGNLPGNVNLLISLRFYNAIIRSLLCFNQKYMQKIKNTYMKKLEELKSLKYGIKY